MANGRPRGEARWRVLARTGGKIREIVGGQM